MLDIPFAMGHAPSDTAEIAISENFMEEMGKIEDWSDGPIGKQVYVSGHNSKQVGEDEWREESLTVSGVYRNIRIGSALDPNMKPSCYFYGYNGNGKPKRFWKSYRRQILPLKIISAVSGMPSVKQIVA